jgi:hypothetical protein
MKFGIKRIMRDRVHFDVASIKRPFNDKAFGLIYSVEEVLLFALQHNTVTIKHGGKPHYRSL